ncbi:MAG: hemerythrin [candidate division Zixibacteria bacterium]|nr:hemerythrin [candidate division Zixibacteria bacterium]
MHPTQILSSEHRVIEIVLDALDRMAEKTLADGRLEKEPALEAIDFIRHFADGCHHAKEEGQLFPALFEKGFPREEGPVAVMLQEHELGRAFVRGMDQAVPEASEGNAAAVQECVAQARGYINLLRAHIQKEDNILFPMADRMLSGEDQRRLAEAFDRTETEEVGEGVHERYLKLAALLAERYGVPHESLDHIHGHGSTSCGHHIHD